jgi:hypothetical protein
MLKIPLALVPFIVLGACGSGPTEPASSSGAALRHGGDDTGSSSGGGLASDVVVACPNGADAEATCSGGEHCCFTNYTAAHDGYCTTTSCFYGTVGCDGPEDCDTGEICCMAALVDPNDGAIGYTAACRAGACAETPLDHELCHVGGDACSNPAQTCSPAATSDADLPRALAVCL